jgi:hypothetical protein
MHTNPDTDRDAIDRRAALTLMASATVALKATLPSAAQAQAADFIGICLIRMGIPGFHRCGPVRASPVRASTGAGFHR